VQVRQTDVAGNSSVAGSAPALTVDATAPATLAAALAADTGSSASDGITRNGVVNITGLETGASWEFSTNGGTTWAAGTGTSFTLASGSYAADAVQVRQTDLAGNFGGVGRIATALTVDTTAAAPTQALATDSGASASDGTTNVGAVNVGGLESGATWAYSTDGGANFTAGTGTSFTLPAGTYAIGAVQVRQTDVAGNTSAVGGNAAALTVDTAAPSAPTVALASDNGSSASDGITNLGTVDVSGLEVGASWEYSTNGGTSFSAGTGTSFTLATGSYAAGAVQVRQIDVAGNTGVVGQIASAVVVDTVVATPAFALASDTGASGTDGTTRTGTVNVTGLEADATWQFSTNGGVSNTIGTGSSFTLPEGTYSLSAVRVVQTDVAGNRSGVALNTAVLTVDTAAPSAPGVALGADTGSSNSDGITRDGSVSVSGLEPGASWEYSTNAGTSYTAGTGASFTLESGVYTAGQVLVRQTDLAGNLGTAASVATGVTIDSVAPTVAIQAPSAAPDATGKLVFDIVFGEAVSGFDASDVVVANGTKGTLTPVDALHYQLEVTPTSSATPLNMTLDVAAGAATDVAGNDSTAATQLLQSMLFGTGANDALTVGASKDFVFLGAGGNDTVAIGSAAHSTAAATDVVAGLTAGDRIDLAAMLGTGSGYTQALSGDVGAGFIELQNLTLTKNLANSTTAVRFNVNFDAAEIAGAKVAGAVVDLVYDYSVARALSITNPTFADPNTGDPVSVWATSAANATNGKIALAADQDPDLLAANPIIDATGRAFGVTLTLNGLFDAFKIGLEAKSAGGVTEVSAGGTQDVAVGVSKLAGSQNGALFVFQDTGTLGAVGDNQLHFVTTYDAPTNTTHLQLQFDTNSVFGAGQTAASTVVAMDFEGNVQSLIPAALHYVGP
jgi:hypothetical protein